MKAIEEKLIYSAESSLLVARRKEESFPFEWHFHDAFEITLIIKGEGQRFVGDSIESYKEGDLVFLPPELAHTWKSSEASQENEAIYIQFDRDCIGKGTFEIDDFRELHEMINSKQGFVFKYDEKVAGYLERCLSDSGIDRLIYFFKILKRISLLEKQSLASISYETEKDEESRVMMDKLMRLLNNDSAMQVPEIAVQLNMSESTFRRFIKKNTGRSLVDFTNLMKISQACQLLINTKKSVSEIALESGYSNLSHFNRKFKEYKNITPRSFRSSFS
ncbi:MAG: helix-turn-helix domain-containing protein [Lentisphaeraceae bacterium]|nr:helix-turn-helix domain-containing protein [Lentisphaeraceae bacterium]